MKKIVVYVLIVLFFVAIFLAIEHSKKENINKVIYLIPSSYTGWVEIHYEENSYHSNKNNSAYIYTIPESGTLLTSDKAIEDSWVDVEYYFVDATGKSVKTLLPNKDIFGSSHEETKNGKVVEKFFVGTEKEFKNH